MVFVLYPLGWIIPVAVVPWVLLTVAGTTLLIHFVYVKGNLIQKINAKIFFSHIQTPQLAETNRQLFYCFAE